MLKFIIAMAKQYTNWRPKWEAPYTWKFIVWALAVRRARREESKAWQAFKAAGGGDATEANKASEHYDKLLDFGPLVLAKKWRGPQQRKWYKAAHWRNLRRQVLARDPICKQCEPDDSGAR